MIVLVVLLGLALGVGLNRVIAWQLRNDQPMPPTSALLWVPLAGSVLRRNWLDLTVELLTLGMTVVLWSNYGWSLRFAGLLAATLVLIDTGAIDWRVKLIDTLVMVIATVLAVVFAPVIITASLGAWLSSLLGLLAAGFVFMLFFMIAKIMYPGAHAPFGMGDIFLGMFIGALVGFYNVGAALFYGMLLAGLVSLGMMLVLGYQRARLIPISYGTFLCLGVLLYFVVNRV